MNLSARLSTAVRTFFAFLYARLHLVCSQANTGQLDEIATRKPLLTGNLSSLQVQAIVMASVAALFSFALGKIVPPLPDAIVPGTRNSTSVFRRDIVSSRIPKHAWTRAVRPSKPFRKTNSGFRECVIYAIVYSMHSS